MTHSQFEYWNDESDYHSNSTHPYCQSCQKYLVVPTIDRFMDYGQYCEHYPDRKSALQKRESELTYVDKTSL